MRSPFSQLPAYGTHVGVGAAPSRTIGSAQKPTIASPHSSRVGVAAASLAHLPRLQHSATHALLPAPTRCHWLGLLWNRPMQPSAARHCAVACASVWPVRCDPIWAPSTAGTCMPSVNLFAPVLMPPTKPVEDAAVSPHTDCAPRQHSPALLNCHVLHAASEQHACSQAAAVVAPVSWSRPGHAASGALSNAHFAGAW